MNPFELIIAVVALAMITGIVIRSMELRHKAPDPKSDFEKELLRKQVTEMQQRIKVLERIVTDGGIQTAAHIEALREQEKTEAGEEA